MPARSPDPLVEYVVALCGRVPGGVSRAAVAGVCGVSPAALCRWLASDPAQHRDPSPRSAAVLRDVIARLETGSR
jgi:hypothetical protein